jgi:hypothetical protein
MSCAASVIRSAAEIERLESIAQLAAALLADDRNKVLSAYRLTLEMKLKEAACHSH